MTATNRFRWLATALAAAVLALASQLAQAHGGHAHERQAAPQAADGNAAVIVVAGRAASNTVSAAWSQSCPDGSGGGCCCTRQPVSTGTAKAAIGDSSGWVRPASLPTAQPESPPAESRPQQPVVSRALPRAPPFFS